MNFKKLTTIAMTGLIFVFGFSQVTSAAVVGKPADSKATIQFKEGTDIPGIVDPTDPEIPWVPVGPGDPIDPPTGEKGPLTLDHVSSVAFGEHEIEGTNAVYESTILRPFIQVSDRRGTGAGWNVTATVSEFETVVEDVTKSTLKGFKLNFSNGSVISTSNSLEPTPSNNVELIANGDAVNVVTAGVDAGLGTWVNRWFPTAGAEEGLNDSVTLEVPAGAATLGAHTATVTWSLSDAPGQ